MNPGLKKALVAAATLVAVVTLTLNFILLDRLHRTNAQVEKLKQTHDRLSDRELQPDNRHPKPNSLETHIPEAVNQTTPEAQSDPTVVSIKKAQAKPEFQSKEDPDQYDDLTHADIHEILAEAIEGEFPELELTDLEMEELASAVLTIRESMVRMREIERTREGAEVLADLQTRRDQAFEEFERITGMSTLEFMLRSPSEGGIDND